MPGYNVNLQERIEELLAAPINFSASGDNVIIAGLAGQISRVYRYFLVVGAATNLTFRSGATALTGAIPLAANEAMVFTFDTKPWYTMGVGNSFIINSSNAVQVSGAVYYLQENA